MTKRMVTCKKRGVELAGLEKPPFPGPLGQQIFEQISQDAWDEWRTQMQIKVLNEYRLNMADPKDYKVLVEQMKVFLNLQAGTQADVENPDRGGHTQK